MHSNVYILNDKPEYKEVDIEEELIRDWGADYASEEVKDSKIIDELKWLASYYKIPIDIIEKDSCIIGKVNRSDLITLHEREVKSKIKKIKEEIEDSKQVDLYRIAYLAYYEQGFLFYSNEFPPSPITDKYLLDYIKKESNEPYLYIIAVWDYHF